jgi:hypothetical protein
VESSRVGPINEESSHVGPINEESSHVGPIGREGIPGMADSGGRIRTAGIEGHIPIANIGTEDIPMEAIGIGAIPTMVRMSISTGASGWIRPGVPGGGGRPGRITIRIIRLLP